MNARHDAAAVRDLLVDLVERTASGRRDSGRCCPSCPRRRACDSSTQAARRRLLAGGGSPCPPAAVWRAGGRLPVVVVSRSSCRRTSSLPWSSGPWSSAWVAASWESASSRPADCVPADASLSPFRRAGAPRSAARRRTTPQTIERAQPPARKSRSRPRHDERHHEREDDERGRDDEEPALVPGQRQQHGLTLPRGPATRSRYCSSGAIVSPRPWSCVQ